jgi:hypothetical protein
MAAVESNVVCQTGRHVHYYMWECFIIVREVVASEMKISSLRAVVASLALLAVFAAVYPAVFDTAHVTLSATVESSVGGARDAWLVSRGLLGSATFGEQSRHGMITPPSGVEVDETRQRVKQTGQVLMQVKSWNETVGDETVHIEVSTLPNHQYEIGFWLLPNHLPGCTMFEWTLFESGRALQSRFWRSDARPRLTGAHDLPNYLYPDAIPWMALLRVLNARQEGAEGTLNQQITPYNYVGQNVTVQRIERITVPAGSFSALKVTAQVDVATMMPDWPHFILHIIKPAVPKDTVYFDSTAPFRLLKQEGPIFVGGPQVTTELIRFYVAGAQPGTPAAAALGGSSISK